MIIKILAQLILAVTAAELLPVDAAFYEWQAGVGTEPEQLQTAVLILPQADERFEAPIKIDTDSFGIVLTAQSATIVDRDSGAVLFQKQASAVRPVGSVTKLMSALVFLERKNDLGDMVTLDPARDYVGGGIVYLGYYDGVSLFDVLRASLIGSDNTATQALVYFSGLTNEEFVKRMNVKAGELAMTSTQFTDPTGVDAHNVSSALDVVTLLRAAESEPTIKEITEQARVTITQQSGRSVSIVNTNGLLETFLNTGEYLVIGGKTGYLPQAGYVLASTVEKNGHAVHVVVLGSASKEARVQEAKGLAYWAFKTFSWK